MREFQGFGSIERLQQNITITEKIHGSNAQILIDGADLYAGSRTRWITPDDDNYNFAKWAYGNREVLIPFLGEGAHFGEWYGSGINAGYGLKEKRFALFNTHRWGPLKDTLPPGVDVVPVLYSGPYGASVIDDTLASLKAGGSVLVPGFSKPEGVVVRWDRSAVLMKRTFEAEDEAWNYKADRPAPLDKGAAAELCAPFWQPLRLEKLLSRDEAFGRDYPSSLPKLASAYVTDLTSDTEIDEATAKLVRKHVFVALKGMMAEKGYSA